MNKTFKIVFNKARGALMVANEITGSVQKKGVKLVVASALFVTAGCASATTILDTTQEVGAGDYSVNISAGETVTINAKDGNVSLTKGSNSSLLVGAYLEGSQESRAVLNIEADTFTVASNTENKAPAGLNNFVAWQQGYSDLSINANSILIGTSEKGGDRGFQFKGDNNTLTIHANTIKAYVLDGFINAQGITNSTVNIGTAANRIGYFEAHTTYPESYILVTRFPRSWRNISRRHGITS